MVYYQENVNEIREIQVFLGSNLNFTVWDFTWSLANYNVYKKNIPSNLINNKVN